jgi:cytochrome c oxidase subunit 4
MSRPNSVHVVSVWTYALILAILLALTLATVRVAFLDLGVLNDIAALTIAVIKMVLVILFFMHLRHSPRLTWLVVTSGFVWLGILIALTLNDYMSRGWLGVPGK